MISLATRALRLAIETLDQHFLKAIRASFFLPWRPALHRLGAQTLADWA